MRFVWHGPDDIPAPVQVVIKTSSAGSYHIGFYDNGWRIRNGKKFSPAEEFLKERITGWAYIGGEL